VSADRDRGRGGEEETVALTEWRPFSQAGLIRPTSLLDEFMREVLAPGGEAAPAARFSPRVDVTETEDGYAIDCELPGVAPEDVRVTLTGDTLTIQGEKRRDESREEGAYHVVERAHGAFQRTFTFPAPLDPDSVEATSEHGVLCVRVTKAKEAKPRRIQVKSGRTLGTTAREVPMTRTDTTKERPEATAAGEEEAAGDEGEEMEREA
jgi:HSP20 family protein